jgi:predicted alpha/beta-fold hydrolase
MDLRGAGAAGPHSERLYTAAASEDVRVAVGAVRERNPESRVVLVGFSLGGNIALKLAGEAAERPVDGLAAVGSVGAPIDLIRSSELILKYPLYDRFYVRNLLRQVDVHARQHPHVKLPGWPRRMSLRLFDDLYTAPRNGYAGALEYYRHASSFPLVPRIELPAFLLTARDDPFVAWQPYADLPTRSNIQSIIAPGGGHLAFLGPDGRGGIRWAETRIVDWILEQTRR